MAQGAQVCRGGKMKTHGYHNNIDAMVGVPQRGGVLGGSFRGGNA